jgi:hypothetical protein
MPTQHSLQYVTRESLQSEDIELELILRDFVQNRRHRYFQPNISVPTASQEDLSPQELDTFRALRAEPQETSAVHALGANLAGESLYIDLVRASGFTQDVAKLLDVEPSRVRQRIQEHSLFAFNEMGRHHIPLFQFEGDREIPGLADVVRALPKDLPALAFANWFTLPSASLDNGDGQPIAPRDYLLKTGDSATVASVARYL